MIITLYLNGEEEFLKSTIQLEPGEAIRNIQVGEEGEELAHRYYPDTGLILLDRPLEEGLKICVHMWRVTGRKVWAIHKTAWFIHEHGRTRCRYYPRNDDS